MNIGIKCNLSDQWSVVAVINNSGKLWVLVFMWMLFEWKSEINIKFALLQAQWPLTW